LSAGTQKFTHETYYGRTLNKPDAIVLTEPNDRIRNNQFVSCEKVNFFVFGQIYNNEEDRRSATAGPKWSNSLPIHL